MIVVILLIISIIVFLSVQPQPSKNKSRQQADSGFFGFSDNGSHHDGCGSDSSDSGCGGGD
ncbi:hypothetical protein HPX95_06100 [Bacillus tequilensis]|uniref:hypothetical protein n=1 Tax=Bacillus tequilensis TaxID=227866 RepID=UPI0015753639|nr:hypothetical protein [Bacillus tequilensis]NTU25748.1 hypothetical protein [Bacillus tequilensis]